jgi:glucose-1-phosphate cytidylyltransferase
MHELGGDIFLNRNGLKITENLAEQFNNWTITALETGQKTQTGGRVAKMLKKNQGERMLITYGDGLADVDVVELVKFHESHGKLATLTCVRPPARFGHLEIQGKKVVKFGEKSQLDVGWINGGYFVLESEVAEFVLHDEEPFETGALSRLVRAGELMAFEHTGFWHPMDTIRERDDLAKLAQSENPPWLKTRK